jgi:hypothetical protein
MRAWLVLGAIALSARGARAQPVYAEEIWRLSLGGGVSGTPSGPTSIDGTFAIEAAADARVNPIISLGAHLHYSIRNWEVIGDYYRSSSGINDAYGYAFGWIAGTGMIAVGPELVFGEAKAARPWCSVGTSLFVYIDTRAPTDHVILGHAAAVAAGWDLPGRVGLSVRAQFAPHDGVVFATNGLSVFTALATLDIRIGRRTLRLATMPDRRGY